MIDFPNCKINVGLNITGKRPNGYHELSSVFLPVPRTEILEILPTKKNSLELSGISIPGNKTENICMKAWKLLNKDFQLEPVRMILHKCIPIGAGLGGGSADGAFALRMLSEYFNLWLEDDMLASYAEQLGSDCPFFIYNQPMYATGTGTDLSPLDLQENLDGYRLVLVNPKIHVSTKTAYAGITVKASGIDLPELVATTKPETWEGKVVNDFEASLFPTHREIEKLKDAIYEAGAAYSSMTGSGSTVYGILKTERLESAVEKLREQFPKYDHWSQGTEL